MKEMRGCRLFSNCFAPVATAETDMSWNSIHLIAKQEHPYNHKQCAHRSHTITLLLLLNTRARVELKSPMRRKMSVRWLLKPSRSLPVLQRKRRTYFFIYMYMYPLAWFLARNQYAKVKSAAFLHFLYIQWRNIFTPFSLLLSPGVIIIVWHLW